MMSMENILPAHLHAGSRSFTHSCRIWPTSSWPFQSPLPPSGLPFSFFFALYVLGISPYLYLLIQLWALLTPFSSWKSHSVSTSIIIPVLRKHSLSVKIDAFSGLHSMQAVESQRGVISEPGGRKTNAETQEMLLKVILDSFLAHMKR